MKSTVEPFSKPLQNFINGSYASTTSGRSIDIIYSPTNEKIGELEVAGTAELEKAIEAAAVAQKKWAGMLPAERADILYKASEIIRSRLEELAYLEVLDTGKPIQEALDVDIISGADAVSYFAHATATLKGNYYQLGSNYAYAVVEPLGIVAGIGAWNYPFQIACWKSAPALAGGNAMIYKPSELTGVTALKLAEIYKEAGLPDGLFQVLQGDAELGKAIVAHAKIKKVSLTGEVNTGKKIMANSAETLKHVTLELGGKSPIIVFEDADIENAVQAAMLGNFYTQGEVCSNGTRVFVHKSIEADFLKELKAKTEKLRMGDPLDPQTQVGALIDRNHYEKVTSYIKAGLDEGAVRFTGEKKPGEPGSKEREYYEKGCFVCPTVFTNCNDSMKIVREEIFGPVMCVLSFETEEEAIERANNTPYGLAAGLFTRDISRANRVSSQLEAGIVWINTYNITPIEIPFGGYKESGLGRENSLEALKAYTQIKTIYVETGDVDSPYR